MIILVVSLKKQKNKKTMKETTPQASTVMRGTAQ